MSLMHHISTGLVVVCEFYIKLQGLQWWFVIACVTFWQQYQRQECSPRIAAWVFALLWHSMITCQPSSQACSESSSRGNSDSINTSCPCLPSTPNPFLIGPTSTLRSLIDLPGHATENPRSQWPRPYFPRLLSALPCHSIVPQMSLSL